MFKRILPVVAIGGTLVSGYVWFAAVSHGDKPQSDDGMRQSADGAKTPEGDNRSVERVPNGGNVRPRASFRPVAPGAAQANAEKVDESKQDAELDEAVAVVIAKLEEAIASGNMTKIGALLSLLRNSSGELFGKGEIPASVRRVMVRAVSAQARAKLSAATAAGGEVPWGDLAASARDLADFVGDADSGVSAAATQAFNSNAFNPAYSDSARAVFVVEGSQLQLDDASLAVLMSSVNNMRHSVACDTIEKISQVGSESAKASLETLIQRYTVNEDIRTVADLKAWLSSNPDGANDDMRFGGFQMPGGE